MNVSKRRLTKSELCLLLEDAALYDQKNRVARTWLLRKKYLTPKVMRQLRITFPSGRSAFSYEDSKKLAQHYELDFSILPA